MAWCFHYDDVDPEIQRMDLNDFPTRNGNAAVGVRNPSRNGCGLVPHTGRGRTGGGGCDRARPRGHG
jgi:hypothetical protein